MSERSKPKRHAMLGTSIDFSADMPQLKLLKLPAWDTTCTHPTMDFIFLEESNNGLKNALIPLLEFRRLTTTRESNWFSNCEMPKSEVKDNPSFRPAARHTCVNLISSLVVSRMYLFTTIDTKASLMLYECWVLVWNFI